MNTLEGTHFKNLWGLIRNPIKLKTSARACDLVVEQIKPIANQVDGEIWDTVWHQIWDENT